MSSRIRILMIDDHTLFRESLVRLLEREPGFEVVERCATVAEGLEVLEGSDVDVVLLDYDLGDEVGTELLKRLDMSQSAVKVIEPNRNMAEYPLITSANGTPLFHITNLVMAH